MSFSNSNFGESLQIDGLTLQQTPIGIAVIPNNLPINYSLTTNNTSQNIVISTNSTLSGDIICNDFTINSGITLITNGYNIYCNGNFINNGTINCGFRTVSQNFSNSYGGSGGGASSTSGATNGYNTVALGGSGAGSGTAGNGLTPTAPTLSNSVLQGFYTNGMANYVCGAGGGIGAGINTSAYGSYGIYIQAVNITAGIINCAGQSGGAFVGLNYTGAGGGGGGTIILSYQTTYTSGSYSFNGGGGGSTHGYTGGSGGNGQVLTFQYTTQPIIATGVSITSTQSVLFTNTITLSAEFNIKSSIAIQINGSTSQPATIYYYIDGSLIQSINAFNGSCLILSAQKLAIGTHTFQIQGILTSGTTSCTADLSAFLIEQVIGNGG